jgi:FKBP-type peptidyl-prolyl cis-trans isomerase 2
MRRLLPAVALALLVAACGGSDDAAGTSAASDGASGDSGRVAAAGDTVAVHYRGTLDDGSEFDSSEGREPLTFQIGSGQVITGFDTAVTGMVVGETRTVRMTPDEAYGERSDDMIIDVPLSDLPEGVAVGDELVSPQGARVTVLEVGNDSATIDMNHPLAGEALTFEITLVSIDG